MRLDSLISPTLTVALKGLTTRDEALAHLADLGHSRFPHVPARSLLAALRDRESKFPTGTPEGVAFPHALMPEIPETALVVILLRPGVRWSGQNHPTQDLIFGILGNADSPWAHVRLLARLARIARAPGALERLRATDDGTRLCNHLRAEDEALG